MLGSKGPLAGDGTAAIPRTHILTDVAAEHMVSDFGAILLRDGAAHLDREVGDAQPGIESIGRAVGHDRRGWAGVDAARARAAAVRWRRIRLDLHRNQQLAEEKPGAHLLIDEAGVLADPAQAGPARIEPPPPRAGVDPDLVFRGRA